MNSRDTLLSQRSYDARSSMVWDGFAMGWVLGILPSFQQQQLLADPVSSAVAAGTA